MKKHNIQLQAGLSLSEFIDTYGTVQQCEAVLEKLRWPDGFRCKKCSGERHCYYRRNGVLIFQCSNCRKQVSLTCLALGQEGHRTLRQALDSNPMKSTDGRLVFAVFHCGGLGLANRSFELQESDWRSIKKYLKDDKA